MVRQGALRSGSTQVGLASRAPLSSTWSHSMAAGLTVPRYLLHLGNQVTTAQCEIFQVQAVEGLEGVLTGEQPPSPACWLVAARDRKPLPFGHASDISGSPSLEEKDLSIKMPSFPLKEGWACKVLSSHLYNREDSRSRMPVLSMLRQAALDFWRLLASQIRPVSSRFSKRHYLKITRAQSGEQLRKTSNINLWPLCTHGKTRKENSKKNQH